MSGQFTQNEFAALPEEDLHFLRIFVLTEGHIKEMESALGVSYPLIKAKLARLKQSLAVKQVPTNEGRMREVLSDLAAGRIGFERAVSMLKGEVSR